MAEKTARAGQTATRKKPAKGDGYTCEVCGLAVTVDTACGCAEVCDIICCGQPMQPQKRTAGASRAQPAKRKTRAAKA